MLMRLSQNCFPHATVALEMPMIVVKKWCQCRLFSFRTLYLIIAPFVIKDLDSFIPCIVSPFVFPHITTVHPYIQISTSSSH